MRLLALPEEPKETKSPSAVGLLALELPLHCPVYTEVGIAVSQLRCHKDMQWLILGKMAQPEN